MSATRYQIGRLGQVWSKAEASFGVAHPSLTATDALRHLNIKLDYNPRNRVLAPDRYQHPSQVDRRTRRTSGTFMIGGILFPSGTLGTTPDNDEYLLNGLGAVVNPTPLSTTVASSPTATGATLTSGTGLAVGQAILLSIAAGANAGKYVRWLTSVAGAVVQWAPALPAAQLVGDTAKSCITYQLATNLPASVGIAHYLPDISFQGLGCVIDQLKIIFDANDEVRWEASGPMANRTRPATTAKPGAFTTAGNQPPSGLTGGFTTDGTPEDFVKAVFTITNGMVLDNMAGGTNVARGFYRDKRRVVQVDYDSQFSDDTTMIAAAESTTPTPVLVQSGNVEGNIVACYCPLTEFEVPNDPDTEGVMSAAYKGVALATAAGNNEFYLALA